MQITIHYRLNQEGRLSALKQGIVATEMIQTSGEVDADAVAALAAGHELRVTDKGEVRADAGPEGFYRQESRYYPTAEELVEVLTERMRLRLAEQAERDRLIADVSATFLATPAARADRGASTFAGTALSAEARKEAERREAADRHAAMDAEIRNFLANPTARARGDRADGRYFWGTDLLVERGHPRWVEVSDVIEARRTSDTDAKEQARLVRTQAKLEYLRAWIDEHGTESMKERAAVDNDQVSTDDRDGDELRAFLGVVPQSEVLDAIRDHALAALDAFPRYERLTATDIHLARETEEDYCEHHEVTFGSGDAAEVPAATWDALKRLRAVAPEGADCAVRLHTATCDACDLKAKRFGILVSVDVAPGLTLHREYSAETATTDAHVF